MDTKPLLVIDVDGVLNRLGARLPGQDHLQRHSIAPSNSDFAYTLHLDRADGARLLAMTDEFDLAWGTTWEDDANLLIAPHVGLPCTLPVAHTKLSEGSKAPGVARLADGRPFVWLDDNLDEFDRAQLADYPAPWAIVDIDPQAGLTDADLDRARKRLVEWGIPD